MNDFLHPIYLNEAHHHETNEENNSMSQQYPQVRFYKIDVDELPDISQEVGVTAMPTFVVFKGGEKVQTVVGANPPALEAAVKNQIS